MGYLEQTAVTGETIAYRAHLHWVIYKWCILCAIVGTALAFLPELRLVGAACLLVSAIMGIAAQLNQVSSELAVTNKRVVLKTGLITRRTHEMFLNKVESLRIEQTLLGRILGYGEVRVEGTGNSDSGFRFIANPLAFRRAINEQVTRTMPS